MDLKKYEIDKWIKSETVYKTILVETDDGLYFVNEEKNEKRLIGNFILRLVSKDITKNQYHFDVYTLNDKQKFIKSENEYVYEKGESLKSAIIRFDDKVSLTYNKIALNCLETYIKKVIEVGIKSKNIQNYEDNQENIEVKNCLINFMLLINGRENIYFENDYESECKNNWSFIEENNIKNNKDLYIVKHNKIENYKKIGYIEKKMREKEEEIKLYYIHLKSFLDLLKKECKLTKEMTSQKFNKALHDLNIMALEKGKNVHSCKSTSGVSVNLTVLYADELKKLAYKKDEIEIDVEPDPEPPIEPPEDIEISIIDPVPKLPKKKKKKKKKQSLSEFKREVARQKKELLDNVQSPSDDLDDLDDIFENMPHNIFDQDPNDENDEIPPVLQALYKSGNKIR